MPEFQKYYILFFITLIIKIIKNCLF